MAFTCISPLSIKNIRISSPVASSKYNQRTDCSKHQYAISETKSKDWRAVVSTALAAAIVACSSNMYALADLNKFEADIRGEFGIGSAAQFGSADLKKAVHVNENFRRANFTAADMRESDFSGSTFNGAYLEKAVAYKANFTVSCPLLPGNFIAPVNQTPITSKPGSATNVGFNNVYTGFTCLPGQLGGRFI